MPKEPRALNDLKEATRIIEKDGAEGYQDTVNLVGTNIADELLARLIRDNMASLNYEPKEGEVEKIVARVRKKAGLTKTSGAS